MLPAFAHMQRFWDPQLDSWNVKILPGEYYVTRGEEAISTVLGLVHLRLHPRSAEAMWAA